jgi:hypothetical protein
MREGVGRASRREGWGDALPMDHHTERGTGRPLHKYLFLRASGVTLWTGWSPDAAASGSTANGARIATAPA